MSQVAFSLLLLIAAGVFVRTLSNLLPSDYRNDPDHILLFTMKPQQEIYSDERRRLLATELIRRVSALPGVQSAPLAENGPLGSRTSSDVVQAPGRDPIRTASDSITPGFFDIPLVFRASPDGTLLQATSQILHWWWSSIRRWFGLSFPTRILWADP